MSQAAANFKAPGKQLESIFFSGRDRRNDQAHTPSIASQSEINSKHANIPCGVPAPSDSAYLQDRPDVKWVHMPDCKAGIAISILMARRLERCLH